MLLGTMVDCFGVGTVGPRTGASGGGQATCRVAGNYAKSLYRQLFRPILVGMTAAEPPTGHEPASGDEDYDRIPAFRFGAGPVTLTMVPT